MTPREWERIKQVFESSLRLPVSERGSYLESACSNEPNLRTTVEELLESHEAAEGFLDEDNTQTDIIRMFKPGTMVAQRFRLVRFLARGGMGEVYEAFDDRLKRRIALKTIRRDYLHDQEHLDRFRREVWVMLEVMHPGICRVFDLVEHSGDPDPRTGTAPVVPCLTMELLEGETLQQHLRRKRPLPLDLAADIMRQVIDALGVMHSRNIIHRDLKPSNIILLPKEGGYRAVLTDFGLARPVQMGGNPFVSVEAVAGAPYFMAPEVLRGAKPTIQSDIYSLGLVMDEMVSTERAFSGNTVGLCQQKLFGSPPPLSKRSTGLPKHWIEAIERCMHSDPEQRFASVADFGTALEKGLSFRINRRRVLRWTAVAGISASAAASVWVASTFASSRLDCEVALYPIENKTGQPDHNHQSVGLDDQLLRRLQATVGVKVSRIDDRSIKPVKREKPLYLLEGDLRGQGSGVLLSFRLVDAGTNEQLWARYWDASRSDLLSLHEEVAEVIIQELRLLSAGLPPAVIRVAGPFVSENPAESPGWTSNAHAYDAYTHGLDGLERRSEESTKEAVAALKKAISLDPNFAVAYCALARATRIMMDYGMRPYDELLRELEMYVREAIRLAPQLSDAHLQKAALHQMRWEWKEADFEYKKAIQLAPNDSGAYYAYAGLIFQIGTVRDALASCRRAIDLDSDYGPHVTGYAYMLLMSGETREAANRMEKLLKERESLPARNILGQAYAILASPSNSDSPDAYLRLGLQQAEKLRRLAKEQDGTRVPRLAELIATLAYSYHGDTPKALEHLQLLEKGWLEGYIPPGDLAKVYAVRGEADKALDLLEEEARVKHRDLLNIRFIPYYANIREHPRFLALLNRMGLRPVPSSPANAAVSSK